MRTKIERPHSPKPTNQKISNNIINKIGIMKISGEKMLNFIFYMHKVSEGSDLVRIAILF